MISSVDSGKENTKYYSNGILGNFKTRITEGEELIKGVDVNSYNIVINGVLYKVGDTGAESSLEVSKDKDIHRVSILTALALTSGKCNTSDIRLVTGTPVNLFFSDERDKIKEALIHRYSVIFREEVINLNITKVLVVPESMGVIYTNYSQFKDMLVKVVDIGGLNSNGCIYKNGVPMRDSIFTVNLGINILINKLKNELNRGGYNYQTYEVEHLIKTGKGGAYELDTFKTIVINHLQELKKVMRANNWNVDTGEVIFTGGGSALLNNYITEIFKNGVVSTNSLYDNVKGFYKIGESLLC